MKVLVFLLVVVVAAQANPVNHNEQADLSTEPKVTQIFGKTTKNSSRLIGVDFLSEEAKSDEVVETTVQFPRVSHSI